MIKLDMDNVDWEGARVALKWWFIVVFGLLFLLLAGCAVHYFQPQVEKLTDKCYMVVKDKAMSDETFVTWVLVYYNEHPKLWGLEIEFVYNDDKRLIGALFWIN